MKKIQMKRLTGIIMVAVVMSSALTVDVSAAQEYYHTPVDKGYYFSAAVKVTDYNADGNVKEYVNYIRDNEGRQIKEEVYNADGTKSKDMFYEYDSNNNKKRDISYYYGPQGVAAINSNVFEYDSQGRISFTGKWRHIRFIHTLLL